MLLFLHLQSQWVASVHASHVSASAQNYMSSYDISPFKYLHMKLWQMSKNSYQTGGEETIKLVYKKLLAYDDAESGRKEETRIWRYNYSSTSTIQCSWWGLVLAKMHLTQWVTLYRPFIKGDVVPWLFIHIKICITVVAFIPMYEKNGKSPSLQYSTNNILVILPVKCRILHAGNPLHCL